MREELVRLHRAELLAAAQRHRLAAAVPRGRRPSPVLRLYARIWWATRPRRWSAALFEG